MTSDTPTGGLEDIVPLTTYAPTKRPRKRDFKPWHRPRKQYVRREQWLAEARWALGQRQSDDDGPLRYLGLPGQDLLDLRYLHSEICVPDDRRLRFLGFDESADPKSAEQGSFNVSLQEVMQLPRVIDLSEIRPEDFRRLSDTNSLAWDSATRHGPFDLVNLDLCGDVAADAPALDDNLYTAITQLFGLQRHQDTPWVFLLTTRVGGEALSEETWRRLANHMAKRMQDCPELESAVEAAFGSMPADPRDLTAATAKQSFEATALGFALWMAHLATQMHFSIQLSSCVAYRVYGGAEYLDMLSVAFRFVPTFQALTDGIGLAGGAVEDDGCAQDSKLPKPFAEVLDVDELLQQETGLLNELVDEMAELLRQARYDADEYKAWSGLYGTP